jgi:phage tail-like protein
MADPNLVYRFKIEIAGIQEAHFTECSGFEAKIDVEEYKEGGANGFVHKIPGRQSFGNITLKRGMSSSTELWAWLSRVVSKAAKKEEKKNISVVQYNSEGKEVLRWDLVGAYPVKWTSPSFQSDQSGIAMETLELTFQELTLVKR